MKMKFAVIGHPVAHSLSPKMHQANFKAIGFDGTYEKFDVAPEDVEAFVREKQREGYAGLNVTVPHKLAVIPLLDHVDVSVARYGACNTLKFEADGTITGYNTDVIGFVEGLAAHGFALAAAAAPEARSPRRAVTRRPRRSSSPTSTPRAWRRSPRSCAPLASAPPWRCADPTGAPRPRRRSSW